MDFEKKITILSAAAAFALGGCATTTSVTQNKTFFEKAGISSQSTTGSPLTESQITDPNQVQVFLGKAVYAVHPSKHTDDARSIGITGSNVVYAPEKTGTQRLEGLKQVLGQPLFDQAVANAVPERTYTLRSIFDQSRNKTQEFANASTTIPSSAYRSLCTDAKVFRGKDPLHWVQDYSLNPCTWNSPGYQPGAYTVQIVVPATAIKQPQTAYKR